MDASKKNNEYEPFLDENCKTMTMTAQTKFGLTFGQIITLISYTAFVVMLYANISSRIASVETDQKAIKSIIENQQVINTKLTEVIGDTQRSLIRIEGKLDLKADKNWTK